VEAREAANEVVADARRAAREAERERGERAERERAEDAEVAGRREREKAAIARAAEEVGKAVMAVRDDAREVGKTVGVVEEAVAEIERRKGAFFGGIGEQWRAFDGEVKSEWGRMVSELEDDIARIRVAREACEECMLEMRTVEVERAIEFQAAVRCVERSGLPMEFQDDARGDRKG
jgi:hypothetical protein